MLKMACKLMLVLVCAAAIGCLPETTSPDSVSEAPGTGVATAVFTLTPAIAPTKTEAPPTATPLPTATAVAAETPTPPPPTQTPSPTAAAEPALPAGAAALLGPDIAYADVQFTLDPALGEVVIGGAMDEFGGTAVQFDLEGNDYCDVGRIRVWNTAALEAWEGQGPYPPMLRSALINPDGAALPTWGAAVVFQAKTRPLAFQNGNGIRALVNHAQDAMLANNESLRYEFFGFTEDEAWFVWVCFPVTAPILLDSSDYSTNGNSLALPLPEGFDALDYPELAMAIQEYNREAELAVENLKDSELTPDIALLDALAQSLVVMSSE